MGKSVNFAFLTERADGGGMRLYSTEGKTPLLQREKLLSPPLSTLYVFFVSEQTRETSPFGLPDCGSDRIGVKEVHRLEQVCVPQPLVTFGQFHSFVS